MGTRAWTWLTPVLFLAVLAAPSGPVQGGEAGVPGGEWRLERIGYEDGRELHPNPGGSYTVEFQAGGRLTGRGDPNRIFGPYTVAGERLTIGPLASTRIAFRPGSIEREFIQALQQAESFRVERRRLRIGLKENGGTIVLTRSIEGEGDSDAEAMAPLVGEWSLTHLTGVRLSGRPVPTLLVEENGRIGGNTGVNSYGGQADLRQLAEGRLSLGPVISTKRAGTPEANRRESRFLAELQRARVWKLSGRTLYLQAEGEELLRFYRGSAIP